MEYLPENCISHILSLTTPLQASRFATVSKNWKSAAYDGCVWEAFLPRKYKDILREHGIQCPPKTRPRDIFFQLCESICINGSSGIFKLKASSGKVMITLNHSCINILEPTDEEFLCPVYLVKDLSWTRDDLWTLPPFTYMFKEVRVVDSVPVFKIFGTIKCSLLSEMSYYSIRLVCRVMPNSDSFWLPVKARFTLGDILYEKWVYLKRPVHSDVHGRHVDRRYNVDIPEIRDDMWVQVELFRFFYEGTFGDGSSIEFSMGEEPGQKGGLILIGIEIYPLD